MPALLVQRVERLLDQLRSDRDTDATAGATKRSAPELRRALREAEELLQVVARDLREHERGSADSPVVRAAPDAQFTQRARVALERVRTLAAQGAHAPQRSAEFLQLCENAAQQALKPGVVDVTGTDGG